MSDMVNHRSEPNVEITWDNDGNVNVIFVKDVQPGEQLFKCYGRKSTTIPEALYIHDWPLDLLSPEPQILLRLFTHFQILPIPVDYWPHMAFTICLHRPPIANSFRVSKLDRI